MCVANKKHEFIPEWANPLVDCKAFFKKLSKPFQFLLKGLFLIFVVGSLTLPLLFTFAVKWQLTPAVLSKFVHSYYALGFSLSFVLFPFIFMNGVILLTQPLSQVSSSDRGALFLFVLLFCIMVQVSGYHLGVQIPTYYGPFVTFLLAFGENFVGIIQHLSLFFILRLILAFILRLLFFLFYNTALSLEFWKGECLFFGALFLCTVLIYLKVQFLLYNQILGMRPNDFWTMVKNFNNLMEFKRNVVECYNGVCQGNNAANEATKNFPPYEPGIPSGHQTNPLSSGRS